MSRIKYFLQQVKEFAISFVLFSGCAVFPRSQNIMVKYLEFVSCFHCCVIVLMGQVTRAIHRQKWAPTVLITSFIFVWDIFLQTLSSQGVCFNLSWTILGRLFSSDLGDSNRCWCQQRGRRVSWETNHFPCQAQMINWWGSSFVNFLALCSCM